MAIRKNKDEPRDEFIGARVRESVKKAAMKIAKKNGWTLSDLIEEALLRFSTK